MYELTPYIYIVFVLLPSGTIDLSNQRITKLWLCAILHKLQYLQKIS